MEIEKEKSEESEDGKGHDFFGLWSCIMGAGSEFWEKDDLLGEVLNRIFKEEYKEGHEALEWFEEELNEVKDATLNKNVRSAAEDLVDQTKYFYLAAGFALGGLYDVMEPKARKQIEYLRKAIHDSGIFPMPAKLKA